MVNGGAVQRSRVSSVALVFDQDVGASLSAGTLQILDQRTGQLAVPASAMAVSYDSNSHTATWTFPGLSKGVLPDGDYMAVLQSFKAKNASGTSLIEAEVLDVFALEGDANGDGLANDLDLYQVWQNRFRAAEQRNPDDDLNGDGTVDPGDFQAITENYLQSRGQGGGVFGDLNVNREITTLDVVSTLPAVQGQLVHPERVARLLAGWDQTPLERYADIGSSVQAGGKFAIAANVLEQINQGKLADGGHVLNLVTVDLDGNTIGRSAIRFHSHPIEN